MSAIIELFGRPTATEPTNGWDSVVRDQQCPFLERTCIKVRKSAPELAIGTCSVLYGKEEKAMIICPFRLLERRQVFLDCIHLLSRHQPGNELHIVPEVSVPGGSVDYFLVSVFDGRVRDFVGIELQALDTTGTVWPARQRFLRRVGVQMVREEADSAKRYGMNWKMTAKTTLIQLHHKIQTFEGWRRHLVLVVQDEMLEYLKTNFRFSHFVRARSRDSMHVHAYSVAAGSGGGLTLRLDGRLSTDAAGIAVSLGLQGEAHLPMEDVVAQLEGKMSNQTRLAVDGNLMA